ncbi:MAG: acyl-CoA dehydrogenase family protein, partial [Bradymonadaceae bacterium]
MSDVVVDQDHGLERELLLEAVKRFINRTLEPAVERPDKPMGPSALSRVLKQVEAMGLTGADEPTGLALWEGFGDQTSCDGSLEVLRLLGQANVATALAVHHRALGRSVAREASLGAGVVGPLMIAPQPSYGLGRGPFARASRGQELEDEDTEFLSRLYASDAIRVLPIETDFGGLLTPVWADGRWSWHFHPRDALKIGEHHHAHGLEELMTVELRGDADRARVSSLSAEESAHLVMQAISAQQAAVLAISTGAVERALGLARVYARQRHQGGHPIAHHPAVMKLLGDAKAAVHCAEAALVTLGALLAGAAAFWQAISLRSHLQPALADAANAALQVFGGMGYMRDVGLEKIVRDVNHLRALGGSPRELMMVDTGERSADEQDERCLAGHVPADDPLSPRTALQRLPLLIRPLARYEPMDPWETDTRALPHSLGRYRRRMRAFAEGYLMPASDRIDVAPHDDAGALRLAASVLQAAGRQGLLSDMLPLPFGSGDPRLLRHPLYFPAALKAEEFAAIDGGLMLLICAHSLGVAPLLLSGDLALMKRYLWPPLRQSQAGRPHIFAYAITEPAGGSDVEDAHGARGYRPGVVARRANGGYLLSGRKCFISGGDIARSIVVFAALEGQGVESWTAFLIKAEDPGFQVARRELKMGMRASGTAELELNDVFIPNDRVIGGLGGGWALNRAVLNMSRIPVAAMGVGFARAATQAAERFACRAELGGRRLI